MTPCDDTPDGLRDAWRTGRDLALMAYREAAAADAHLRAAVAA
jgi:hypothetical protein